MAVPYVFDCPACGRHDQLHPAGTAGDARPCAKCGGEARRVWQVTRVIVRPRGYNLRPGEHHRSIPGLHYDSFEYELERGELTEDATGAYTPESRARRQAQLEAEDVPRRRSMAEIDADITPDQHQELHEWGRAAYSQLHPEER